MPYINYAAKETCLKIVYYGPGLGGKTTNVEYVHARIDRARRGALLRLNTDTERTLFFDFMPLTVGALNGFKVKLHVYTVPGQIHYAATRKLVMRGADGVVFVADSQEARLEANCESLDNLDNDIAASGLDLDGVCVMQYNKRDSAAALPVAELRGLLNLRGWPEFEAVAVRGEGVFPTLKTVTRLIMDRLRGGRAVAR